MIQTLSVSRKWMREKHEKSMIQTLSASRNLIYKREKHWKSNIQTLSVSRKLM